MHLHMYALPTVTAVNRSNYHQSLLLYSNTDAGVMIKTTGPAREACKNIMDWIDVE